LESKNNVGTQLNIETEEFSGSKLSKKNLNVMRIRKEKNRITKHNWRNTLKSKKGRKKNVFGSFSKKLNLRIGERWTRIQSEIAGKI